MTLRLGRRQFLMGSSALAAAAAFGASPAFGQNAGLRQFFWGGQARADRTYGVNDLFKAANGADVDSSFLGWGDYWPKLATETAGGNAPDIIQMDYRYIVEYAKRGAIAPLDEFVGGALKLDGFDEDQLEGGKVDGKLYGISLGANSVAQLVNVSAFEEAGIELPSRDTTYDDIRAMGVAFLSKNIRGGMRVIADGSGSEPMLDNWLRQKGLALYTADGKLGFDADAAIEWFTMWNQMRADKICVDAETQALDTNGPLETTMVVLGKAAMMPSNSNQLVAFQAGTIRRRIGLGDFRVHVGVGGQQVEAFTQAGFGIQLQATHPGLAALHAEADVGRVRIRGGDVLLVQLEGREGDEAVAAWRLVFHADFVLLAGHRLERAAGEVSAIHWLE